MRNFDDREDLKKREKMLREGRREERLGYKEGRERERNGYVEGMKMKDITTRTDNTAIRIKNERIGV